MRIGFSAACILVAMTSSSLAQQYREARGPNCLMLDGKCASYRFVAKCFIQIDSVVYLNKPCNVVIDASHEDIAIGAELPKMKKFNSKFQASIRHAGPPDAAEPKEYSAHWNGEKGTDGKVYAIGHVTIELGDVEKTRNDQHGTCYLNSRAKLCFHGPETVRADRDMICRGILTQIEDTGGDNIKIGPCQFTIDQYTGAVITTKCRLGEACTVQARVRQDERGLWIKHVYGARTGK